MLPGFYFAPMLKAPASRHWLLVLLFLAGCSSMGYERQAITEIIERYGGECTLTRGYNFTTRANEPRGGYLTIKLTSRGLSRRLSDPELAASNCAYLTYHGVAAGEPDRYATYRVSLTDPDSALTRTYTYPAADLALVARAADNLVALVAAWQQHELLAATATVETTAPGAAPPDSMLPLMRRTAAQLAPLTSYSIEGFRLTPDTVAGRPVRLVQLLVAVPQPEGGKLFMVSINPARSARERFLYRLRVLP